MHDAVVVKELQAARQLIAKAISEGGTNQLSVRRALHALRHAHDLMDKRPRLKVAP